MRYKLGQFWRLLAPRPSNQSIYAAILDAETVLKADEIVQLNIIDRQTAAYSTHHIKRTVPLFHLRDHIAKEKKNVEPKELELRLDGNVVDPSKTCEDLNLKNGTKLQISKPQPEPPTPESWLGYFPGALTQGSLYIVDFRLQRFVDQQNSRISACIDDIEQLAGLTALEAEYAQESPGWVDTNSHSEVTGKLEKSVGSVSEEELFEDASSEMGSEHVRQSVDYISAQDSVSCYSQEVQSLARESQEISAVDRESADRSLGGASPEKSFDQASRMESPSRSERVQQWVDRNSEERVEDEQRMRDLLAEKFKRKSRLVAEKFGW